MRVFLAFLFILRASLAQNVAINVPCNKELDGLLTADPDGDERAFMSCQGVGVGTIGFWERKLCPNNMKFDFINQQCKSTSKKARKQQTLNIAILNNSCANGETCIGGSVCDLDSLRCMCPYGTTPKLDTLSCESSQPAFVSATVDGPSQFFNSLSGANGNRNNNFLPYGQTDGPEFQPNNNNYKYNNNQGSNQNNQNNNNNNNNFNWNPSFSWAKGNKQQPPMNNVNNGQSSPDFSNPFQPNPNQNQKFVFNFNKNNMGAATNGPNNNQNPHPTIAAPKQKVATLAIPGASCKSNEICIGGSICTLPIGICLCPGDLEARDGECVLPAASTIAVSKVGIGALCSELAECDHGSSCLMGRCTCISPLIQHEGKCVLRQQQKVVGPGELCDNGEICGRGSVCDVMIPVCVCPAHTDLNNGECIQVTAPVTQPVMTPSPSLPPIQVPVQTAPPPTRPPQPIQVQTSQFPHHITIPQVHYQTTAAPIPIYTTHAPTTQYIPKQIYTAPPPQPQPKASVKINQMKIGGSKQAGVGVRCSLNTDCMIGAYCNGNTNPPSCQCLSTHVNIEGRCEKVIYPGQVGCRSDTQCHSAYTGTHCIDRICVCPEGQKAVDQTCVSESSRPNQTCGFSTTNPCSGESVCYQNLCICPDRSYFNSSTLNCEISSTLPTPSSSHCFDACSFPNVCIRGNCVCPDNTDCSRKIIEKRITKREVPAKSCAIDSNICSSRNAVCIDEICQCLKGFHESDGVCVYSRKSKSSNTKTIECNESVLCPVHWSCENRKCECDSKEFDADGNCVPLKFFGSFKSINNQCSSKDRCAGGSKCKEQLCQCVDGSVELSGKCKQFPGGYCSNGEMCSGGSSCYLGICRCDPTRTLDNQRCVQTSVAIGSTCRKGQQCVNGAACRFGMCMCVSKKVAVLGRCVGGAEAVSTSINTKIVQSTTQDSLNKKSGMPCFSDDFCLDGTKCMDGICMCENGSEMVYDKCIPKSSTIEEDLTTTTKYGDRIAIGEACSLSDWCVENATCTDGKCTCFGKACDAINSTELPRHQFSSRITKLKAVPGSSCKSSHECPFRTKCVDGVCRCKRGETIIESTCRAAIHQVLPGSVCDPSNGYDCIGESSCQYGVCKCLNGMASDGQQCTFSRSIFQIFPGKSCSSGEPCGGGSYCAIDKICRCANDEVPDVNKKCVKKSKVIPVFNKMKTMLQTTTTTTTTTTTVSPITDPAIDYTNFEQKLQELEMIEFEMKNSIPAEPSTTISKSSSIVLAGHTCHQNSECPPFAFCFTNTCNCMAGFRASSGYCEAAIGIGETCISSNQCVDNAECVFGRCSCIPSAGNTCKDTKMAHPGEDCSSTKIICSYNSYCSLMSGVCECPSGMATKGDKCENTFESVGKDCVTSRNCQKSSYCDNGFCVCKVGHKLSDDVCITSNENVKHIDSTNSFNFLPYNKNAGENTPLQNNMKNEFRGIQETTNEGLFETTTRWPEFIAITVPTFHSQQPAPTQSGLQFPPSFSSFPIAYGAKIVAEEENKSTLKYKMAFPGEYCGTGEVCLGNSMCRDHFCRCLQDVTAENGVCPPQIDDLSVLGLHPLGRDFRRKSPSNSSTIEKAIKREIALPLENCQNEEQCARNSTCLSIGGLGNICQCNEGTVYVDTDCLKIDDSYELVAIDEECDLDSICTSGSECNDGKCECPDEKVLILGICVTVANPDTSCENGQVCINGSICNQEAICECPKGHSNDKGICIIDVYESENIMIQEEDQTVSDEEHENSLSNTNELRKLVRRELSTSDCVGDSDCKPNFRCQGFMCVCDGSSEKCLTNTLRKPTNVPPGSYCNKYQKCANDSICYKNYCVCSYEDMPIDDQCVARDWHLNIGSKCSLQTRCREDLQCIAGICMCKFGDVSCDPSEPVTSPPGGSCSNLRECTGGSVCREGWCICPDPSMIVNRGICIQSGPKPTLPPRNVVPQVQVPVSVYVPQVPITKAQQFVTEAPLGRKIVPGGKCGPLDACVGGSYCIEGFCLCPAGQHPSSNGRCEKSSTIATTKFSPIPTTTGTTQSPRPASVYTSAYSTTSSHFTIADLLMTRRPPAFIEIPTHETLTSTVAPTQSQDECTAIGLICRGNTVCRNKSCQCPDGYVLHHDGCISPEEAAKRRARGKARHEASTAKLFAKPSESCSSGQTCVGESQCSYRNVCECPQDKPEIKNGQCTAPTRFEVVPGATCNENSICTKGSSCENGLCRCPSGYIAVSANCVAIPVPVATTPKARVIAKPLESCEDGETCDGGSSCDIDTGICMCPPGQIVFNVKCMPPPTKAQPPKMTTQPIRTTLTSAKPSHSTDCEQDSNCGDNKTCVSGKCKCKPGFVDNSGTCEPLEDIDVIERPIPVSYAKHKVATLSERMIPKEEIEVSNNEPIPVATSPPRAMQETQKPRVVGPPIRRPKPKNKNSGSGSGSGGGSGGNRNYKTGSGNGNCPPGNEPTRDESSGKLIMCNGLEPNCPPRSYCYITTGGFATEEYNCCKSW